MNSYEAQHINKLRPYLAECCVLLKSNGDFPIPDLTKIALFGAGVRHTYKGGTGSGEVNSRYYDNVEKGFINAGIEITTKAWLDAYDMVKEKAFKKFIEDVKEEAKKAHTNVLLMCMGKSMPAPEYEISIKGDGDTAIYVVARESGEGADRNAVKGDIYLSDTEVRDILECNRKYKNFMLVLNVGGPVDLTPVLEVKNILILSQLGVETGDALSDIVLGKSNPSGKLTTTWTSWPDYPNIDFGGFDETRYKEGIYVGYRYFDTVKKNPLFPFGFGLSYTNFEFEEALVSNEKDLIKVTVPVKNIGNYPGKEVVQVYVSSPVGRIDHPYQVLAGFKKTSEIKPGESCEVTISFRLSELASYVESSSEFALFKGDYIIRVGNSSRLTSVKAVINLPEDVITKKVRSFFSKVDFTDYTPENFIYDEDYKDIKVITLSPSDFETEIIDYDREFEIDPKVDLLSDGDLLRITMGNFNPSGGLLSMIGNAGSKVPGSAGDTAHISGIRELSMADGPAGLRIAKDYFIDKKSGNVTAMAAPMPESMLVFATGIIKWAVNLITPKPKHGEEIKHQYCTAIPIGTAVAQTWNEEFAFLCGDIVGSEMEIMGVDLWLAPALNIHRSIRCGRNFEYYSEDPLVSGRIASGIIKGVQRHKSRGVTIKHFAANNQEFNRTSSNSIVSERALREIYLKGFEICIKEADPYTVMSSYNLINGVHTSENYGLLTNILRHEFGFKGFVMTDWVINGGMIPKNAKYRSPDQASVISSGNDVYMPGSKADYKKLVKGFKEGRVSEKSLKIAATRVLRVSKR